MITRGQRITIAILIPLALASVSFALILFAGRLKSIKEKEIAEKKTAFTKIIREKYEWAVKKSKGKQESGDVKEEFELLSPAEIGKMENDRREKILGELLDILKSKSSSAEDFSAAYYTLINFREKAPPVLARLLREEADSGVGYIALKACVELKTIYDIDGDSPGAAFLDLALAALAKADPPAGREIAKLLGCYRDKRARDALVQMLRSDDSSLVYYAILSLGKIGARRDVPKIVPFLTSPDRGLRAAACRAMDSLLSYNAGREALLLKDYDKALEEKAGHWLEWWRRHSGK